MQVLLDPGAEARGPRSDVSLPKRKSEALRECLVARSVVLYAPVICLRP